MITARARIAAAAALVLSAIALAHYTQVWAAIPAPQARTSDFAGTYVAATLWRSGQPQSMYDVPAEERVMAASGAPLNHLYIPFENPPLAAVVAAPLSLLDATTAYHGWSLLQLALLAAGVVIAVRAAPRTPDRGRGMPTLACVAVALAGFGTGLLFVEAQWDGVPALGLALAYSGWRRGWMSAAGYAIGLTAAIAKPHLAIGVLAFMVGRRDWRGLAGAAAGAATVGLAGLVLAGPSASLAFIAALLQPANSPTSWMQGATGLFGSLLGGGAVPYALALGVSAVALVGAAWLGTLSRRRADLLEPALLGAVTLSLLASPHLLGHDLTLLSIPIAATLVWSLHREGAARTWPGRTTLAIATGWAAVNVASLLDLGQSAVGLPGRLTPWMLATAGGVIVSALASTTASERRGPLAPARAGMTARS